MNLEDLGYSSFFESKRNELGLGDFSAARVVSEHKGAYKVQNPNGEFLAKVTGKQMFTASSREDYPAVGDWVAITELNSEQAVIKAVLPRRSIIKRKSSGKNLIQIIATNIDVAFVIESVDRDFNLNRIERYFAITKDGGIKPAIILNKTDLIPKEELDSKIGQIRNRFENIDVFPTSTKTLEGLAELKSYFTKGNTYCFLGSSGVGKSSLINRLLEKELIKTKDISEYSGRGKHATTGREMYFLENGGIVIDNPGMREVGLADAASGVENLFDDIKSLAKGCKFNDCTHTHEPGCNVLAAVKNGEIEQGQYSNFINLKKEADYFGMTKLEKKEKSRSFGKFLNKAKKDLKDIGHKEY
ncbi:MAG: ribosome small subunit-dependent GTPase A [Acidobacteriaceae bacterium]